MQGYLAHKKPPSLRTLQYDHAVGPMVVLEGGWFLMSEAPLYCHVAPRHRVRGVRFIGTKGAHYSEFKYIYKMYQNIDIDIYTHMYMYIYLSLYLYIYIYMYI
jgi:hypothetical protein